MREMEVWEETRRLNPSKRRRCVDHETVSETGGGSRSQRLRGSSASDQLASATRMYAQALERLNAVRREREEIMQEIMQDQFGSHWFSLSESLFTTPQAKEYLKLRRELEILRVRELVRQTEGAALAAPASAFSELCFIEEKNEYLRLREILDLARIRKLRARIAERRSPAPALMEGR